MASCSVYKGGILLGTGTTSQSNATISAFTVSTGRVVGAGRNVSVTITEAGANIGKTFRSRVTADGGTSLTLAEANPFA